MTKKIIKSKTENKIKKILDKIRPSLQMDGGDIEFVSWEESSGKLKVRLTGHCAHCPMSQITLKEGVAKEIIKAVPKVKDVISV